MLGWVSIVSAHPVRNAPQAVSKVIENELDGRFAVVTGGASGIGLSITRALRAAGAKILVIGRTQASLDAMRDEDGGISTLAADVSDASQRSRLISRLLENDIPVDTFVNNAGTMQTFDLRAADAFDRIGSELALDLHAPTQVHMQRAISIAQSANPVILNLHEVHSAGYSSQAQ